METTETLDNQFYNKPKCIPALVEILSKSEHWQVRQLAAVELRKYTNQWWSKLDQNINAGIKARLLDVILQEPHKLVRHSTARAISAIANGELPVGQWNNLLEFLYQCCQSPNAGHREVGVYVLYSLFEVITDVFNDHRGQLFELFSRSLNDPESKDVRITTLQALGKIAEFIEIEEEDDIAQFQKLVPSMVNVLQQALSENDEDAATKGFELFDTLILLEAPLLSKHIAQLIEFFLNVAGNQQYEESMRIMALQFMVWVSTYKKAKIQRLKLVNPIISRLMPIGTENDPEDVNEDYPSRMAFRVINSISTQLPPQQVFPVILEHVVAYMQNHDPKYRKAAMMAFAVFVEGCAEYIRPKFNDLLPLVVSGLQDPETIVRKAACIALSCFAGELEEEVTENHKTLMPLVFNLLDDPNQEISKQACGALDAILESLDEEIIVQYLPAVMQKLLTLADHVSGERAIPVFAAIGSAAHAANGEFKPYFAQTIPKLQLLMSKSKTEEDLKLRGVATDTLGAIAEAVGRDEFKPYVANFMQLAIDGLQHDHPQLRECSYCFFSVMARVFGSDFAPYLEVIMPQLIKSCQIEEKDLFEIEVPDEEDLGESDEEDDAYAFNHDIIDEKEIAAEAIGEIFTNAKSDFLPYVEPCVNELNKLGTHHADSVRKTAARSLCRFMVTFYEMAKLPPWEPGLPLRVPVHSNVETMVKYAMSTIVAIWEDEEAKSVVIEICQQLVITLKECGPCIIADCVDEVSNLTLKLFEKTHPCQTDQGDEDGVLDDDEEAELDAKVIDVASDYVAAMALVIGPEFAEYFKVFLPHIKKYYKKSRPVSDRSMAIGCLGECALGLKEGITPFTETILPLFLKAVGDEADEVRSNGAYGIGLLCQYSKADIMSHYPAILTALHSLFGASSFVNIADNACGAVSRMILAHPEAVPLEQVLQVLFSTLPLKQDFEENEPVFECIFQLFRANNAFVFNQLPILLNIFAKVLGPPEGQLKENIRKELIELIRALAKQYPEIMNRPDLVAVMA